MTESYAVLWDLDGTLINSEPLHHEAVERVLSNHGLQIPGNFSEIMIGFSGFDTYCYCRDWLGLQIPFDDWVEEKNQHYMNKVSELDCFEVPAAVFHHFDKRLIRQAIVSNSDRLVMQANLAVMGLQEPSRVTVSRNDVRHGKPTAEPYLRAAWLLQADPAQCVVIEDSAAGAKAGVAAGMQVLGVVHDESNPPDFPEEVIDVLPFNSLSSESMIARITALFDACEAIEEEQSK